MGGGQDRLRDPRLTDPRPCGVAVGVGAGRSFSASPDDLRLSRLGSSAAHAAALGAAGDIDVCVCCVCMYIDREGGEERD